MATSKETLAQMSKPAATVVKILEENWLEIRESCKHFESGRKCPITEQECTFTHCPLLEEKDPENMKKNNTTGDELNEGSG